MQSPSWVSHLGFVWNRIKTPTLKLDLNDDDDDEEIVCVFQCDDDDYHWCGFWLARELKALSFEWLYLPLLTPRLCLRSFQNLPLLALLIVTVVFIKFCDELGLKCGSTANSRFWRSILHTHKLPKWVWNMCCWNSVVEVVSRRNSFCVLNLMVKTALLRFSQPIINGSLLC